MDTVVYLGIRLVHKNKACYRAESVCGMGKHMEIAVRGNQPYSTDVKFGE